MTKTTEIIYNNRPRNFLMKFHESYCKNDDCKSIGECISEKTNLPSTAIRQSLCNVRPLSKKTINTISDILKLEPAQKTVLYTYNDSFKKHLKKHNELLKGFIIRRLRKDHHNDFYREPIYSPIYDIESMLPSNNGRYHCNQEVDFFIRNPNYSGGLIGCSFCHFQSSVTRGHVYKNNYSSLKEYTYCLVEFKNRSFKNLVTKKGFFWVKYKKLKVKNFEFYLKQDGSCESMPYHSENIRILAFAKIIIQNCTYEYND